jgi:hypothetical protein
VSTAYGGIFDPAGKQKQLTATEEQVADPNFWNDSARSQDVMRERKRLTAALDSEQELARRVSTWKLSSSSPKKAKTSRVRSRPN